LRHLRKALGCSVKLTYISTVILLLHAGSMLSWIDHSTVRTVLARDEPGAAQLVPGTTITQEVSVNSSQNYEINLTAGDHLQVIVVKRDLHLSVTLFGPDGGSLGEFVSRRYGPLRASVIAETSGPHRLVIRTMEKEEARGRYQLRVEKISGATAEYKRYDAAARAYAEAERLRTQWKEGALCEAIARYTDASMIWNATGRHREAAQALGDIGDVYFILSKFRQALAFYQKALAASRVAGDRLGEHEALCHIGYACVYLGDNQRALRYLERVLKYYSSSQPSHPDDEDRRRMAQALNNTGEVYYSLGDTKKALDFFNRALNLWTSAGDRSGQGLAQINIGYVYYDSGKLPEASEHYRQSLQFWRAVENRRGEALASTALGGVYSFLGEKQAALDSHTEAMRLFRDIGDRQGEAAALNGIGKAYEDLNEQQTALDSYNRALSINRQIGNRNYEALGHYYVGRVYSSKEDFPQALANYNICVALSRQVGDRRIEGYALKDIGMIYNLRGEKRRALTMYHEVLRLYVEVEDRRGQAYALNNIGQLYYQLGDVAKALDYFARALTLSRATANRYGEISTLYNIALAERERGNLSKALSCIESSVSLIESLRVKITSSELRTSYFASTHQHYELFIDLLMQMHRLRPDEGFANAALNVSERARARSLLETLAEAKVDIRQKVDQPLLERERTLQQLLDAKAAYQMRLLGGKHPEEEAARVNREINDLTTEYREVQAQIRAQSPAYAILTQPRLLSLEDIQGEVLSDDSILLEYVLGEERSYLWAVTPTSHTSYELPKRSVIEESARKVYDLLTARQPAHGESLSQYRERVAKADAQYWREAASLSRMLLGPAANQLGTKRLLIVSDGVLQYIPFEALPAPPAPDDTALPGASESAPRTVESPLVLGHAVVYLPSASILATIRRDTAGRAPAPKTVVVLADPVFDKSDSRILSTDEAVASATDKAGDAELHRALRDFGEDDLYIPRLPSTLHEAESIMMATPSGMGDMVTGFEANRTKAMGAQLSQYQIVHFATHGIINNEHPDLSGIILSMVDDQGRVQNGFLRLHDIYNLKLSADLAVLSACRTGLGKDVKGEGLVGLTRGFMSAGSKSVIASLWKVDDEATAELMEHFYNSMLKDGLPPEAALRAAKAAMWKQERWRSPYYWAAFVFQGEYGMPLGGRQLGRRTAFQLTWIRIIFALFMLTLLAGFYFTLRRWRRRPTL
jgi:tetratricopeptide (TPR) repeat protein